MSESYFVDDEPDPLPASFEEIIGNGFGNGDYIRAVVDSGRTPDQVMYDAFIAMWCNQSQLTSESHRDKHHRLLRAGKQLATAVGRSIIFHPGNLIKH